MCQNSVVETQKTCRTAQCINRGGKQNQFNAISVYLFHNFGLFVCQFVSIIITSCLREIARKSHRFHIWAVSAFDICTLSIFRIWPQVIAGIWRLRWSRNCFISSGLFASTVCTEHLTIIFAVVRDVYGDIRNVWCKILLAHRVIVDCYVCSISITNRLHIFAIILHFPVDIS